MTKLNAAIARITLIDAANLEIAHCRGQIARANNRPRSGVLVPKFTDEAELGAWERGWDAAEAQLTQG